MIHPRRYGRMRAALLLVFVAVGCALRPAEPATGALTREQVEQNLATQAEEIGRAVLAEDHARMADLTHPELVKKLGGREKYVARLGGIAAEMKAAGFRFEALATARPSTLVQASGKWFGVVPSDIDMTGPGGARTKMKAYQVGESVDGGRTWRFIDANGVGGDRRKLNLILPDFPADVPVPANPPPQWDRG